MKKHLLIVVASVLVAASCFGQGLAARYASQNVPLTASPQSIAGSTATNFNAVINITRQKDVAISLSFSGDAAGTANGEAVLSPSLDGTTNTMDTVKVIRLAVAANGAGQFVCGNTNVGSSVCAGYGYLILRYVTNAAASGNITNVVVAYGVKQGTP